MRRFELLEPASIAEACQILAEREDARVIAGGTALLILIKQGVYIPTTLVNLKKIQGSREVSYDARLGLRIGALASIYEVETAAMVQEHYPILAEACHVVASIRIRNLATIGGNLAHADYQSDPPGVLIALDGRVELTGPQGAREVVLADFLRGSYETTLEPSEVLTAVLVPPAPRNLRGTYIKFTTRSSEDRPCAGVTVLVQMADGVCEDVRLVVGAVSPAPIRVDVAEAMARGEKLTGEMIEQMAAEAARAVDPIEDVRGSSAYKRKMVRVLTRRALAACTADGAKR